MERRKGANPSPAPEATEAGSEEKLKALRAAAGAAG